MKRAGFAAAAGAIALATASLGGLPAQADFADVAVLQGLDKVTARVSHIEVPVGSSVTFGSLEIAADACYKNPPEELPESAAFLRISEVQATGDDVADSSETLFSGWMFASSPALSALTHPVYDVWVIDCIAEATSSEDGETGN